MAKKPSTIVATINRGIDSLKASKRDIANDIRRMQESRKKFHHVLNHIVTPAENSGSISISPGSVHVTYRDLSGFKDLRLETTLEGLTFIGEPTRTRDWADYMNRDYHFTVPVGAYVDDDSKTCRKVKVGEEYRVVDKFQLVCD